MRADERRARRGARGRGFTLLEVLASVLVLGLLYTVLASAAMRGLRSEGIDRRRAEASLLVDQLLAEIETNLALGMPLDTLNAEREEPPYRLLVEVLPEDIFLLLPREAVEEWSRRDGADEAPTLLVNERGESRLQRIHVAVEWEEAGEPYRVARTTHHLDTAGMPELLSPAEDAGGEAGGADAGLVTGEGAAELEKALGGDLPPEVRSILEGLR